MVKNMSDKELLTAADEQAAFKAIYNKYWEQLYKKALQYLKSSADAEDGVQEIFISLWRNKNNIDASNELYAYLFTALKYYVIKQVYRKAKKGIYLPLSIKEFELTELTTDELMQLKEMRSVIATEVSGLPRRMQQIYQLSRVENLPVAKIAKQLNISEQTVKNTLTTALKRIKQKLSHSHLTDFIL